MLRLINVFYFQVTKNGCPTRLGLSCIRSVNCSLFRHPGRVKKQIDLGEIANERPEKVLLVAAIAAPFAAQAELKSIDDTAMSDVSGQSGHQ